MGPLLAAHPVDFLPFAHVSHLLHERITFDKARRVPPIILGRPVSTSSGVGMAPPDGGQFSVVAAANAVLSPSPGGSSQSGSRRRPTSTICYRCWQPGHLSHDCMGARVAGCRACRTAQHTAATCPLGGGASSSLPSLPPAAVPAVVPPPALPSALPIALAPPAPPSRRTFAGRPADGIGAAAVGPFSDLTVTFATESHDSNPSLSNYFSSSVTSAP